MLVSEVEITVPLSTEELAVLDQAVADGHFGSRADAVRQAVQRAFAAPERRGEIEESYRRAYAEHPEAPWTGQLGIRLLEQQALRERKG